VHLVLLLLFSNKNFILLPRQNSY